MDSGDGPAPRWVAPIFVVLGAATVPWTIYLGLTLPAAARTHHYRLAWVGFDVILVALLLATGWTAGRGRPTVGLVASATAITLVIDAWFDVTTSGRADRPAAIASAVFVELPLAAVCVWIALHVDQVIERRLQQVARRRARSITGQPATRAQRLRYHLRHPGKRTRER